MTKIKEYLPSVLAFMFGLLLYQLLKYAAARNDVLVQFRLIMNFLTGCALIFLSYKYWRSKRP